MVGTGAGSLQAIKEASVGEFVAHWAKHVRACGADIRAGCRAWGGAISAHSSNNSGD
jgi:hypothetical protein